MASDKISKTKKLTVLASPMLERATIADRYRQEAIELRRAAEVVRDERLQEQLLSIADDYDTWAAAIDAGGGEVELAQTAGDDRNPGNKEEREG